jgi:hypothetical protein
VAKLRHAMVSQSIRLKQLNDKSKTLRQCDQIREIDSNHSSNHQDISKWVLNRKEISQCRLDKHPCPLMRESKQSYQQMPIERTRDNPFESHRWPNGIRHDGVQ